MLTIKQAMHTIHQGEAEACAEKRAPRFAPAGQSTQMIVGADDTDDRTILHTAQSLYGDYRLRRVYYSAFSPIPHSPKACRSPHRHCCASIGCTGGFSHARLWFLGRRTAQRPR